MNNIILKSKWMSVLVILLLMFPLQVFSTNNEQQQNQASKTITLVVSGEGTTKEEATKNALRSAIEQTFGTFVSANTEVLNDEIIRDQIATVSSGNIESYKVLSSVNVGTVKQVNVQAVVSIGKLISFAKSHGMKAELSGATFAMNMKIKELNEKNEKIVISHLIKQLLTIGVNQNLYDFTLEIGEPEVYDADFYTIGLKVKAIPNKNAKEFLDIYLRTMHGLSLTGPDIKGYKNKPIESMGGYITEDGLYKSFKLRNLYSRFNINHLRENPYLSFATIQFAFICSKYKFKIVDNLGNEIVISCKKNGEDVSEELKEIARYDLIYYPDFHYQLTSDKKENDVVFVASKKTGKFQFASSYSEKYLLNLISNQRPLDGGAYYNSIGLQYYLWKNYLGLDGHPDEQMRFKLYYKKDEFEKLSSIEIKPLTEMKFF